MISLCFHWDSKCIGTSPKGALFRLDVTNKKTEVALEVELEVELDLAVLKMLRFLLGVAKREMIRK